MDILQILVQQYLAGLPPNSGQKTAAEVLGEYLIFLEEVHAMAEHNISAGMIFLLFVNMPPAILLKRPLRKKNNQP